MLRRMNPMAAPVHGLQVACAIAALFACTNSARAQDAARSGAELVKDGNKLLADGKYGDALDAYDQAAEKLPDSAAVAYDRGIALYRLGRFGDAEPAFQDALKSAQTELEAKAKYNLGRCAHEAALAQKDNLEAAINDVSRAIRFYQDALQTNPNDQDAQKNKALAERLRVFLEKKFEQQQKQAASQPSSQPDQPTSQPDESTSQPSSQPQDGEQGQDQQGQEQNQKQGKEKGDKQKNDAQGKQDGKDRQQGADQDAESENKASGDKGDKEAELQEVEVMLQEAREAERQRHEEERQRALRIRGLGKVPKDW